MKITFKKDHVLISIYTILFALISGCQEAIKLEDFMNGSSSVPRNYREKLIFDYFYALKQKRYEDAYNLRVPYARGTYAEFVKTSAENHNELPLRISIQEERAIYVDMDSTCGYVYTVNIVDPKATVSMSGEVSLELNREVNGSCQIAYNSAFGDN
jgi:hypothetical protein